MDKQILKDYIDACAQVKETKEQIRKLRKARKQMVADTSKRSSLSDLFRSAKSNP